MAFKVSHMREGKKVYVKDVNKFLQDATKGSLKDCHKAAAKAVLKNGPSSFNEALDVAERAFKQRRKPQIELKQGDKIILSAEARENLTEAQREKLLRVSQKHAVQVRGLSEGQGY
jgi:hypothetical protein